MIATQNYHTTAEVAASVALNRKTQIKEFPNAMHHIQTEGKEFIPQGFEGVCRGCSSDMFCIRSFRGSRPVCWRAGLLRADTMERRIFRNADIVRISKVFCQNNRIVPKYTFYYTMITI